MTTKASSRKSQEDLCRRLSAPKFRYDAEPTNYLETSTVFSSSNTAGRQRPPPDTPAQPPPKKIVSKASVDAWVRVACVLQIPEQSDPVDPFQVQEQMDRRAFHQEKLAAKRDQEVEALRARREEAVDSSPQQRRSARAVSCDKVTPHFLAPGLSRRRQPVDLRWRRLSRRSVTKRLKLTSLVQIQRPCLRKGGRHLTIFRRGR